MDLNKSYSSLSARNFPCVILLNILISLMRVMILSPFYREDNWSSKMFKLKGIKPTFMCPQNPELPSIACFWAGVGSKSSLKSKLYHIQQSSEQRMVQKDAGPPQGTKAWSNKRILLSFPSGHCKCSFKSQRKLCSQNVPGVHLLWLGIFTNKWLKCLLSCTKPFF